MFAPSITGGARIQVPASPTTSFVFYSSFKGPHHKSLQLRNLTFPVCRGQLEEGKNISPKTCLGGCIFWLILFLSQLFISLGSGRISNIWWCRRPGVYGGGCKKWMGANRIISSPLASVPPTPCMPCTSESTSHVPPNSQERVCGCTLIRPTRT